MKDSVKNNKQPLKGQKKMNPNDTKLRSNSVPSMSINQGKVKYDPQPSKKMGGDPNAIKQKQQQKDIKMHLDKSQSGEQGRQRPIKFDKMDPNGVKNNKQPLKK